MHPSTVPATCQKIGPEAFLQDISIKKNPSACPMCMRWLFGPNNSWSKDMAQAGPEYTIITIPKKQYIANSQSIPYPLKIEIVQLRFIAGGCANPHPALRPVASKVVLPPKIATWAGLPARLPWSRDFFLARKPFQHVRWNPSTDQWIGLKSAETVGLKTFS